MRGGRGRARGRSGGLSRGRVCAPRARRPGRKQERCSNVCVGRWMSFESALSVEEMPGGGEVEEVREDVGCCADVWGGSGVSTKEGRG